MSLAQLTTSLTTHTHAATPTNSLLEQPMRGISLVRSASSGSDSSKGNWLDWTLCCRHKSSTCERVCVAGKGEVAGRREEHFHRSHSICKRTVACDNNEMRQHNTICHSVDPSSKTLQHDCHQCPLCTSMRVLPPSPSAFPICMASFNPASSTSCCKTPNCPPCRAHNPLHRHPWNSPPPRAPPPVPVGWEWLHKPSLQAEWACSWLSWGGRELVWGMPCTHHRHTHTTAQSSET